MTPTNNALPELLPCPFCGLDVNDDEGCFPAGGACGGYYVRCGNPNCHADLWDYTKVGVIEKWNRRASAGREAVATDPMTLSAPEKVWLQVTTDADDEDDRLPIPRESWMDLSWCYESIGGHEVVYIREDLAHTAPELPKQGEGGREDHSGNAAEMVAVESIIETMLCAAALLEQSGSVINRREGAALRVQADELRALAKKAEGA